MGPKTVVAIVLITLGIVAFAYESITYKTRKMVTEKTRTIPLPPIVGAIALVGGTLLLVVKAKRLEREGDLMNSLFTRNRIGLPMAALLVAGLSACAQQQPHSQEAEARQTAPESPAPRAPAPEVVRITVPQGTEVEATLSTAVGSETSQVGDNVSATTTAAVVVGDRVAIPAGSTIFGEVTSVVPAHKGLKISEKGGAVALSFDKVTTPGGSSTPMSGSVARVAKSAGKTAGIIGGSAAGGAVLGKILGGETKDAAVGAVLGAGIGTGIAAGTKGREIVIPTGSNLTIILDQPLRMAERS